MSSQENNVFSCVELVQPTVGLIFSEFCIEVNETCCLHDVVIAQFVQLHCTMYLLLYQVALLHSHLSTADHTTSMQLMETLSPSSATQSPSHQPRSAGPSTDCPSTVRSVTSL